MLYLIVVIGLTGASPSPAQPYEVRCDKVERNNLYDNQGRLVIIQYIFWRWDPVSCRHKVAAWKLSKHVTYRPGCVVVHFSKKYWRVRYSEFSETWTTVDPEVVDRNYYPVDKRPDFFVVPVGPDEYMKVEDTA